jgi:hypothetical protein
LELDLAVAQGKNYLRRARFRPPARVSLGRGAECTVRLELDGLPEHHDLLVLQEEGSELRFTADMKVQMIIGNSPVPTEELIASGLAVAAGAAYRVTLNQGAKVAVRLADEHKILLKLTAPSPGEPVEILVEAGADVRCDRCSTLMPAAIVAHGAMSACPSCGLLNRIELRPADDSPAVPPPPDPEDLAGVDLPTFDAMSVLGKDALASLADAAADPELGGSDDPIEGTEPDGAERPAELTDGAEADRDGEVDGSTDAAGPVGSDEAAGPDEAVGAAAHPAPPAPPEEDDYVDPYAETAHSMSILPHPDHAAAAANLKPMPPKRTELGPQSRAPSPSLRPLPHAPKAGSGGEELESRAAGPSVADGPSRSGAPKPLPMPPKRSSKPQVGSGVRSSAAPQSKPKPQMPPPPPNPDSEELPRSVRTPSGPVLVMKERGSPNYETRKVDQLISTDSEVDALIERSDTFFAMDEEEDEEELSTFEAPAEAPESREAEPDASPLPDAARPIPWLWIAVAAIAIGGIAGIAALLLS